MTEPRVSPWNLANYLTVLRLLLVPVFLALLLADDGDNAGLRLGATAVFLIAALTDRIDGQIARSRGLVTSFGKLVDPIADKALIGGALVGLSLLGELPWGVTVLVLVREVGITLLRFVVIRHGVMPAGRGGKLKTVLQVVALTLYLLPLTGFLQTVSALVMGAAVLLTVLTGLEIAYQALVLRTTSERADRKREARS
ncbi:MAG: CDP-diacylglycerol--glycerol-3-phosphate 3-phosphatidyltransferase [Frankiales bacterium]|nr:CDP-diacylglycerol--glycerol-3-phosphate 3-phosphatidyltransferase [Frankiales bacterium]